MPTPTPVPSPAAQPPPPFASSSRPPSATCRPSATNCSSSSSPNCATAARRAASAGARSTCVGGSPTNRKVKSCRSAWRRSTSAARTSLGSWVSGMAGWRTISLRRCWKRIRGWPKNRQRSVTELEILHGVLNNPDMTGQAFFYFRAPAFLETLHPGSAAEFQEEPTPGEIERLGPQAAAQRTNERRNRLAQLKERVRASGLPVREDFADARALGELVLADLGRVIDEQFRPGSEPDPLSTRPRIMRPSPTAMPGCTSAGRALSAPSMRTPARRPAADRRRRVGAGKVGAAQQLGAGLSGEASRRPS